MHAIKSYLLEFHVLCEHLLAAVENLGRKTIRLEGLLSFKGLVSSLLF